MLAALGMQVSGRSVLNIGFVISVLKKKQKKCRHMCNPEEFETTIHTDIALRQNMKLLFQEKLLNTVRLDWHLSYIFCGQHLLCAGLRPSDIDASTGSVKELDRMVRQIRSE